MKLNLRDILGGKSGLTEVTDAAPEGAQRFVVQGVKLDVPAEYAGLKRVINALRNGHYEKHEALALQYNLEPEDRLLDLGSGLGFVACKASQTIPAANITCVEANPSLLPVI
ncbi:MAG: hypothetical protein AAF479_10885, partial [Pseudomonadota bacterium]